MHLNKGPHEGSASLLLQGTLEGELHLSLFHPPTGAHLHTRALIITGSWQGLGVGMGGVGLQTPRQVQISDSMFPGAWGWDLQCRGPKAGPKSKGAGELHETVSNTRRVCSGNEDVQTGNEGFSQGQGSPGESAQILSAT